MDKVRRRIWQPSHAEDDGKTRTWTAVLMGEDEFMALLGFPEGTRLISMRTTLTRGVQITVEEPRE